MSEEFLAQSLTSNQLLALLFICESNRKKSPVFSESFEQAVPVEWKDLIDTFSDRLGNLTETMRFEVLQAHLMSVEDIDVYDNSALKGILDDNRPALEFLSEKLNQDPRFRLHSR